ncbi:MAG: hypothetical protein IT432_07535, partial [Phycisphaerales bacterium]|nr:hypothetical protein [Phycisphaerales bacterium]
ITAAEWKKADKDYKGLSIRDGVRVRTLLRGGTLHEVFITDMPVKTRAEAKADATVPNPIGAPTVRAGLTLKQNESGKWAWFDGDTQKTGAYATPEEAQQSPQIEAKEYLASVRKPAEETSIKDHPEYERIDRVYGSLTREQIGTKLAAMTADIAQHSTVAQREFTGNGTRRTGAAVSAQAVRDIGNEKLLLTAYAKEKFGAEPSTASAPLQRAREAKAAKTLDEKINSPSGQSVTRRELVDSEIAQGGTPRTVEITDTAAVNEAQRRKQGMDRMEGGLGPPFGNPNHPDTIKYRALEETIKNPPKKPEYHMVHKGGSWRMLTKAEYDYAVGKKLEAGDQAAAKEADPYAADIEKLTAILRKQVATETSPRRQGQAAIVVLNGEAPAVQEAVATVLWEIAPEAAEYVASDGPIGMRGRVASAKPKGNWRVGHDAEADPFRRAQILETLANMKSTDAELSDILERLDEPNQGGAAHRVAYAVSKNPAASAQTAALANSMYREWTDTGRPSPEQPVTVVGEPDPSEYDEGSRSLTYTLSDGTFLRETWNSAGKSEGVEHFRMLGGVGHNTIGGPYQSVEAALEAANTRTVTPTKAADQATTAPAATKSAIDPAIRSKTIDAIVEAAKKPRPQIVQTFELEGSDGKWYRANGFPVGVRHTGNKRSAGFAFETPDGTRTGPGGLETREAAEKWLDDRQAEDDKELRGHLETGTDDAVRSSADYWLTKKGKPNPLNAAAGASVTPGSAPMTLADYPKARDRVMSGDQTAEEHKALAQWLIRSESSIKAELGQKTLKQLAPNGTGGNTKASIIDTIYRNMLGRFHLGDSVSYNPFAKETYESALIKKIEATTDEDIRKFKADRQGRIDARKKALENPETPDEFRQFIEKHGEAALSVEQRKKYDELTASLNKRMRGDDRPDYIAKVDTGGVQLTVKEGFHEKAKVPLWIVQMSGRVDGDTYKSLNEAAKKLGGWWSSFKKESTGFQFKTKAAADEFVQINQKSITTEATDKAREENQAEKAAARLIEMADAKIEAADEELGRDRNTNTVRRARMADSAEAGARKAKQMAETLANIAEGIQNGTAKALRGIRNMAQLEELERSLMLAQREYWYSLPEESRRAIDPSGNWWNLPMDENIIAKAVMPMPEPHISHVEEIARKGLTTPGIKREAAKLDKLAKYTRRRNADAVVVKIDNPYDFGAAKAVAARLKGSGASNYSAQAVYDALMHHQRVADMGIKSSAEMRVALREYMGFRAGQAKPDAIREMERGLIGKTVGIDFFPTPPALATEIVEKADIEPGMKVLEPSAGNGRIADAIKAAGVVPDVAEVSPDLRAILEKKGYPLEGRDFMEFNPGPVYDRIVMNPPFSNRMDVEHVRHAYDLLKPGGRIVAIMSEGPFFGQDKKASGFRDWLDTVGTSEQLPEGSFQTDKS